MNSAVQALWWARGTDGAELMTLGDDAEVYTWDIGERRCVRRWKDDGGYGTVAMSGDRHGKYLSIGYVKIALPYSLALITVQIAQNQGLSTCMATTRFHHPAQACQKF